MASLGEILLLTKTRLAKRLNERRSETWNATPATHYRCDKCHDKGWYEDDGGRAFACEQCYADSIRTARIAQSGIPPERWDEWTLDNYHPTWDQDPAMLQDDETPAAQAILDAAQWYLGQDWPQPAQPWLAFIGRKGNGKTHAVAGLTRALIERGIGARFNTYHRLLDELYETFQKHDRDREQISAAALMNHWDEIPVLVLDDIRERDIKTEWQEGQLDELANRRYERAAPLVITSNLPLSQLPRRFADRLTDRSICRLVVCNGPSARPYVPQLRGERKAA